MFTVARATSAIAVIAVVVAAGTSLAGPPARGETVTVTLETPSGRGRPASNLADAFAARVKTLSNGELVVEVVYGTNPSPSTTWPWLRTHLDNVRTNKVQLATVWGASMELAGIKTVRGLYAPFRLTSKEAAAEATSGPIAAKILEGFNGSGLTGLTLAPQSLSRIHAARRILKSVADFDDATIRTPYGPTAVTVLRSLGARPIDRSGGLFVDRFAKGLIAASESEWKRGSIDLATSKTAGNLILYPLTDVLVANTGAFSRLSPAQRTILRRAAADARVTMLSSWDERAEAKAFCKAGGTIVNAAPAEIIALRKKAAAAIARFDSDPASRAILTDVERVAAAPGSVATCAPSSVAGPPTPAPYLTVATLPPSGIYKKSITLQSMLAAGISAEYARRNWGENTLKINGRNATLSNRNPGYSYSCPYTLAIERGLMTMQAAATSECSGDPGRVWWRPLGKNIEMQLIFIGNTRARRGDPGTEANGIWQRAG